MASEVVSDHDQRRLQVAFLVFSAAEFATWVGILVYGYRIGGAAAVGLVAVAQLAPAAILAPPLAALADRISRRRSLVLAYAGLTGFVAAAGVAMALEAPPAVPVGLAAAGAVLLSAVRTAHGAAIPELSRSPGMALAANAVTAMGAGIGEVVGPLLAAALLFAGPEFVFLGMAVLLGAATAAVFSIRGGRSSPSRGGAGEARPEGMADVVRSPEVGGIVLLGGLGMIVAGALDVLLVVLAVEILDIGESGVGFLSALIGVGSIVGGAAAVGLVGRPRLARAVGMGAGAMGAPLLLISVIPRAALLLPATGFGHAYGDVAARTLLQRIVPPGLLGRTFGVLESLAMAGLGAGALLAPVLIAWMGPEYAFLVVGGLVPVGFMLASARVRRADRQARVPSAAIDVLERIPAFSVLEPPALEALALDAEILSVSDGQVLIRTGDHGDRAFVVVEGRVRVVKGGQQVAELGDGEVFGEIALLADVPRTATVEAVGPGRVLALHRQAFLGVVSQHASTHAAMSAVAGRRLAELQEMEE